MLVPADFIACVLLVSQSGLLLSLYVILSHAACLYFCVLNVSRFMSGSSPGTWGSSAVMGRVWTWARHRWVRAWCHVAEPSEPHQYHWRGGRGVEVAHITPSICTPMIPLLSLRLYSQFHKNKQMHIERAFYYCKSYSNKMPTQFFNFDSSSYSVRWRIKINNSYK